MGQSDKPSPAASRVPDSGTTLLILGTLANTTWRMFAPVLILLIAGMWLDGKTHHKPLYTLGGVVLGFAIAITLVYLQYSGIKKIDSDKDKK